MKSRRPSLSIHTMRNDDQADAGENVREAVGRDRTHLVERARRVFLSRARRQRHFNSAMFGEAAWDMLLALYVLKPSIAPPTVSGLVSLSGVPASTALRWLDYLEKERLVARHPSPTDRRVFHIELTDKALHSLDAHFSEGDEDRTGLTKPRLAQ